MENGKILILPSFSGRLNFPKRFFWRLRPEASDEIEKKKKNREMGRNITMLLKIPAPPEAVWSIYGFRFKHNRLQASKIFFYKVFLMSIVIITVKLYCSLSVGDKFQEWLQLTFFFSEQKSWPIKGPTNLHREKSWDKLLFTASSRTRINRKKLESFLLLGSIARIKINKK